jgi:cob(I)alamin adenosyltransferase
MPQNHPASATGLAIGCVQVYTGDGKGKTTAAVGLAVRAAAAGLRVFFGQFIKAGDSSEIQFLKQLCPNVTLEAFGRGRFIRGQPAPEDIALAREGLQKLRAALQSGRYDLVVADEANGAVAAGLFPVAELLALLDLRPPNVELVTTGRNAPPALVERADLVTEMKCVKHCFQAGIPARRGIEL